MRIRADDVRVDQRRAFAGAAMFGGAAQRGITFQRLGAVTFFDVEIRIIPHQLGDAAAGSLHFHRHGNGVAVVFDEIENREALGAGGVQRFVKFTFAGGAIAGRNVSDLVGMKGDAGAGRSFARLIEGLGEFFEIGRTFRRADGLQELRAGGRRARDDVQIAIAPVRRHLAAAGCGIGFGADSLQEHVVGRDAEHQHQGAVAIVREKPIVGGLQEQPGGGEHGFMAGAADLKEQAILALQLDFAIVQAPRQEHGAIDANQGLRGRGLDTLAGSKFAIFALIWVAIGHSRLRGLPRELGTRHYSEMRGAKKKNARRNRRMHYWKNRQSSGGR